MKAILRNITKEIDCKYLQVSAGVRYYEDATINGVEDTEGTLIPLKVGDNWEPKIDIETGVIVDWPKGTIADIHYKVCDDGKYTVLDESGKEIVTKECYVPDILCPEGEWYGDYIIMNVDENGLIAKWDSSEIQNLIDTKSFYDES